MGKYFEIFLNFVVSPKEAIQQIKQTNYIKLGAVIFILTFLTIIAEQAIIINTQISFSFFNIWQFLSEIFIIFTILILITAWVHFISSFFSNENNIRTTLTVFFMSFIPLFFSFPLKIVFTVWFPFPFLWYLTITFLTFIWIFSLFVISVKNVYSLNKTQTFIVIFSPFVLVALFSILVLFSTRL